MFLASFFAKVRALYSKAYTFGGISSGATWATINGMLFATEALSNPSSSLALSKGTCGAFCSSTKSYVGGGYNFDAPNLLNTVEGFVHATEAVTSQSATLSSGRIELSGTRSTTRGYWFAGRTSFGFTEQTEIDGLQFSDESAINPSAALSLARSATAGVYSRTKGYCLGGVKINGNFTRTYYTEIDGIRFSDEAAINPSATLSVARSGGAGVSADSTNKGYCLGGEIGGSEIDGLNFTDESAINPSATLSDEAREGAGGCSSTIKGYCIGGAPASGGAPHGYVDGIRFSDETAVNPSVTVSSITQQCGTP